MISHDVAGLAHADEVQVGHPWRVLVSDKEKQSADIQRPKRIVSPNFQSLMLQLPLQNSAKKGPEANLQHPGQSGTTFLSLLDRKTLHKKKPLDSTP